MKKNEMDLTYSIRDIYLLAPPSIALAKSQESQLPIKGSIQLPLDHQEYPYPKNTKHIPHPL
jgi:hypothetical protein